MPTLSHGERRVERLFDRLDSRVRYLSDMVKLMADEIGRITDELTATRAAVDTFRDQKNAAIAALTQANTDLQAQLATGSPGLTAEQGDAIAARFQAIIDDLSVAPPAATK